VVSRGLAEKLTLIAVPFVTQVMLAAACYGLTYALTHRRITSVFASVLLISATVAGFQVQPMRIDHHGWQIVLAVTAVMMVLRWPESVRAAAVAGLAMATNLVISLEGLPMAALLGAVLTIRGLHSPRGADQLTSYLVALALGSAALLLGTAGWPHATVPWCDEFSPVYLLPISAGALVLIALRGLVWKNAAARLMVLLAVVPVAIILGCWASAGRCLGGPFADLDPMLQAKWYDHVLEGLPVWQQPPMYIWAGFAPLALGFLGTLIAITQSAPERRGGWLELLLLLTGSTLVACAVFRALGSAQALAAPGNAWLLLACFDWSMRQRKVWVKAIAGLGCIALTPWPSMLPLSGLIGSGSADASASAVARGSSSQCYERRELETLNAIPPSILFTPLDLGPMVLVYSHHSVVATGHHRNPQGMLAVVNAFSNTPDKARDAVTGSGARYLVFCDDAQGGGWLSGAGRNHPIADWLRPLTKFTGALRVYEVLPTQ
jgi:hypothetical protein